MSKAKQAAHEAALRIIDRMEHGDPTPEDIRRRAMWVRLGWDEETHRRRTVGESQCDVDLMVCRTGHTRNSAMDFD